MLSIAFSWPAWTGVNTAWLIVWNYFSKLWYKVYGDKEYQSIIKWWNNTFIDYISNTKLFLSKNIDLFFAYDDLAIQRNENIYNLKQIIIVPKKSWLYQNMISIWMFFYIIWFSEKKTIQIIKNYFWNKKISEEIWQKNIESIKFWYTANPNLKFTISHIWNQSHNLFVDGNYLIAEWAVDAWLRFYSAYPMTPASSLIKYITKHKEVEFFQWEDEVAVAMSMLGARFAWVPAMCWTSGGGFALMTESISFANQAEIGWVYILSQRWWPSTWTPTFTEQWDILFAINASFGDTKPIVVYPSNFEEGYHLIQKVLNWSDIYQHPIIVLLDKQFSESYISIDETWWKKQIIPDEKIKNKIKFNPETPEEFEGYKDLKENKFLRYKLTESWISSYTYPGIKNWYFIASSYEHTESWFSTENPQIKKQMIKKRYKKLETFKKIEFNKKFYWYEVINPKAKKFFITVWINRICIEKFIDQNPEYWLIVIKILQPLDIRLKNFLKSEKIEKLIFVELNYSGQLEYILSSALWLNSLEWKWKISRIRKYNNYPLFIEDLYQANL